MVIPTLSFLADEQLTQDLNELVKRTGQTQAFHIHKAVRRYLEEEMHKWVAIDDGIADADAGRISALEEVQKKWRRHGHD